MASRLRFLRRLRKEQFSGANGSVTLGVSLSDMMVGGREQARTEVEAARELGCRMTIHTNCFQSPSDRAEPAQSGLFR